MNTDDMTEEGIDREIESLRMQVWVERDVPNIKALIQIIAALWLCRESLGRAVN